MHAHSGIYSGKVNNYGFWPAFTAQRHAGALEKVSASAGCWNVLVVMRSAAEEVAEFIILSAKSVGRFMLLEAAHTSDASFDPECPNFCV